MPSPKRPSALPPATEAPAAKPGKFAYPGLDRVIHEKARLGIMTSLVAHAGGLSFTDLKDLCNLTDGNLNRHLEVLRDARYVNLQKDTRGARTKTVCQVTPRGRKSFLAYLTELEHVVATAAKAAKPTSALAHHPFAPQT